MLEKLKWTKKPPYKEGWYWVKMVFEFSDVKRIVYVQELFGGSTGTLYFTDGDAIFNVEYANAEWAGPIPEPE